MGFDFGMDETCRHRPFQNCIALFYTTPQIFFIALQSWSSRHVIQFLNLVSKHSPRQCSEPSIINKVRWDSILAWMKRAATALFKTLLHFFIQPPQIFFYCTSKLIKQTRYTISEPRFKTLPLATDRKSTR